MQPYDQLIAALNDEWTSSGFFGRLQLGDYDPAGAQRIKSLLIAIPNDGAELPRRLVALTWSIPAFMRWQRETVERQGGSLRELDAAAATFQNLLEQTFGVP
jgi:hypothetical protein